MKIWVMCAKSSSGDEYNCCESWTHEPSKDEINQVRIKLDSWKFRPEQDDEDDDGFVELNGEKYISFIDQYSISEIEV